jgi:FkbM family methyltransferase
VIGNSAVRLFRLVARFGIHRIPILEPVFLTLYGVYKKFEAGPIYRLKEYVPTGSLVADVGANVGFFSLRFAEWVGDSGRVISIEPEDQNYRYLISALERAGRLSRVCPLKAVAAAEHGLEFLEINPLHPADHKLSRDGTGIPVTAVTVDELVRDNRDLKITLVKIDVQGAEMLVLKGSAETLRIDKPALFIELDEEGLDKFGTSVSAILNYLSGFGYVAHWLMRTGYHLKANQEDILAKVARSGYVDVLFLAVPPSRSAST